jgi:hypothetical protein
MRLFEEGFNWWELSGCAPKNAKEVFAYTKCQDITLEKEKKIILSITSQSLDALVRAKIAALRISFFETQENREELAAHLQTVIDQLPHSPPMEMGWKKYLPLLGKVVPEKNYPPKSEFCPGSVVVGWNKWSQEIQFGVIQFKESENIQVYFKGVEIMQGATASFALLSQEQLEAYKNLFPLCTQASYEIINENFSSVYVSSIKPSVNDWFNFASLIGKQAPESLFKENSSFDPGTICGMVTGDGRYIYAVVIAVAPEKITAMTGENQVYSMDRPIYRELISIPMELLEAEFFKYPPMADTEPLEQKIEERMKTPRQQLEDIARILQKINPLKLTDQDQKFINKPFPIVWGSMKHPQSFWNRAAPELILSGCQFLGSDIQFLFTEPSHVKKVKKYLDAHMPRGLRVQVLPFSELPSR